MSISIYQSSVPIIKAMLGNLSAILAKAELYAKNKKFDEKNLLESRLFPDMFPLVKQIQVATDQAKGGCARLAGIEPPKFEDDETTMAQLQDRIAKTIAFIDGIDPVQIDGASRPIQYTKRDFNFEFSAQQYLTNWVLPNFYFHVTAAYNLLRMGGLEIGKGDFLGSLVDFNIDTKQVRAR